MFRCSLSVFLVGFRFGISSVVILNEVVVLGVLAWMVVARVFAFVVFVIAGHSIAIIGLEVIVQSDVIVFEHWLVSLLSQDFGFPWFFILRSREGTVSL